MEYRFGRSSEHGKFVKTIGDKHSDLKGEMTVTDESFEYNTIHHFMVVDKYLSLDDAQGNCYDWYKIKDYYQCIDNTPMLKRIEKRIDNIENAICDLTKKGV